jgi:hypothetical protein
MTKEQKRIVLSFMSGFQGRTLILEYLMKTGEIKNRTLDFEVALRDFLLELADQFK